MLTRSQRDAMLSRLVFDLDNPGYVYKEPSAVRPPGPTSSDIVSRETIQPKMLVPQNGALLKLKGTSTQPEHRGGGKRGVITGFSYQSRMRLMERMASLDRTAKAEDWLFITLTYPKEWPEDAATWKHHLHCFVQYLARSHPRVAAIWKMEFQKRGAPHFHLLCYGAKRVDRDWLSHSWYSIVGSGDAAHLAAGTRVERPRTWHGVAWYASKYIGKVSQDQQGILTGRIWGIHNRAALPYHVEEVPLEWQQFYLMRRVMRRWHNRAKAVPWADKENTKRPGYHMRHTKHALGCKLFLDPAVSRRLQRALLNQPPNPAHWGRF